MTYSALSARSMLDRCRFASPSQSSTNRRTVQAGAFGALLLLASACGGVGEDGDTPSSSHTTLSIKGIIAVSIDSEAVPNLVSPQTFSFDRGAVELGQTLEKRLRIQNKSDTGPLTVSVARLIYTSPVAEDVASLTLSAAMGPDGAIPITDNQIGQIRLAEGDSLELTVRYLRSDDVDRNAVIYIGSDTQKAVEQAIEIPLSVGGAFPVSRFDPTPMEFPPVGAGATKSMGLTVLNTGSADLELRRFTLSGHPDFRFIYVQDGAIDAVQAAPSDQEVTFDPPVIVAPNGSHTFQVSFTPESPEPASGQIVFTTNEPESQHAVPLSANANRPCIKVTPSSVQFGAKLIGQKAVLPVEIASCGNKPLVVSAIALIENATGNYALNFAPMPGQLAPAADATLTIPVNGTVTLNVEYVPNKKNGLVDGVPDLDKAVITVQSNAFEAEISVDVNGLGSDTLCPTAVGDIKEGEQVIPQTTLHLFSGGSYAPAGAVARRKWTVTQPPGSQSVFVPSPTFANPTFEANVAGAYQFVLDVWDEAETMSCVPWLRTVIVVPDEAIHVELLWHSPGDADETDEGFDAGTDVDLHFVHDTYAVGSGVDLDKDGVDDPWFHAVYDAYWFNPDPNWGSFSPSANDDPGLDRDDTDGAGPENLNLAVPQNVTYRVGVHYWFDHGLGDAYATVRIYIYHNLVASFEEVRLSHLDMWCVATIDWPSGQVTLCPTKSGDYHITPNYQNPNFIPAQ